MRRRAETWTGDSVNRRSEEFCPSGLQWPSPANVAFSSKRARVRGKRHLAGSEQSAVSFSKLIEGNGNIIAPGSWAGIMCRTLIVMYIEFRRPRSWNGGEYEWKVCFYSPIHY